MAAKVSRLFASFVFVWMKIDIGIFGMEDGVSYIIKPGRIDCFYRELTNGTTVDFEMEVKKDLNLIFRLTTFLSSEQDSDSESHSDSKSDYLYFRFGLDVLQHGGTVCNVSGIGLL